MSSDLRPDTLEEALGHLTVENLKPMMEVLSVPEPRPTRKPAIVEAIRLRITEDVLRTAWRFLDAAQRLAVAETLYSPERRFRARRFNAMYGGLPKGVEWGDSRDFSLLHFFLFPPFSYKDLPTVIPKEVEPLLLKFVPRPPEPAITAVDEAPEFVDRPRRTSGSGEQKSDRVPVTRRDLESAAVHDLLRCCD